MAYKHKTTKAVISNNDYEVLPWSEKQKYRRHQARSKQYPPVESHTPMINSATRLNPSFARQYQQIYSPMINNMATMNMLTTLNLMNVSVMAAASII